MAWTGFTDEQLAQLKNEPDEVSEEGKMLYFNIDVE